MKRVRVRSPANIALVKYMGKASAEGNVPAHGSLSLTLSELTTDLEIEARASDSSEESAEFEGKDHRGDSIAIGAKFERHFWRCWGEGAELLPRFGLKAEKPAPMRFKVKTGNRFPSDAGIASSASSFSALTLAALAARAEIGAFQGRYARDPEFRSAIGALSQRGSGSSCRSFDGPWVLWGESGPQPISSRLPPMRDLILVVSESKKAVSSSQAHLEVLSSPLFQGRVERVKGRLAETQRAIEQGDRSRLATLAWAEFWEMHSLFHTSPKPFTYFEPGTMAALRWLEPEIFSERPPIVTMDAGPNVHVMVPESEAERWSARIRERFPSLTVLSDAQGNGARFA